MEIADSAKRLRRSFHAVAPKRPVHMKIDKSRRKIISAKIDNVLFAPIDSLTKIDNFSVLDQDVDSVADSVWQDAARVTKDHVSKARLRRADEIREKKFHGFAKRRPAGS